MLPDVSVCYGRDLVSLVVDIVRLQRDRTRRVKCRWYKYCFRVAMVIIVMRLFWSIVFDFVDTCCNCVDSSGFSSPLIVAMYSCLGGH